MSIARITEISSTSEESFEDAIQRGVARATQTLRNVRSAWVKEQQIRIDGGRIVEYQVNLMITFVLDEGGQTASPEPDRGGRVSEPRGAKSGRNKKR
jgi:flavin-binding protein dodecin